MARGVNKVILIGNLGVAPEVRYMPSGSAMTTFSVATSESWKDKQTGERQDRTEWHRVVLFNKLAEIARDYLKKGSKVYIEGSLRTRKWQDKNTNQDRYTTEIMGTDIQMLDSRSPTGDTSFPAEYESIAQQMPDHSDMDFGMDSYGASTPATSPSPAKSTPVPAPVASKDFDDDIPF